MRQLLSLLPDKSEADIETAMRKVSIVITGISLCLMFGGLSTALLEGNYGRMPGSPAAQLSFLLHPGNFHAALVAMSAGIVLLAIIPAIRVFLALGIYLRRRDRLDALVAMIVVLELLFSMHTGR